MKKLVIILLLLCISFMSIGCKKNYYEFIDLAYGSHERQKLDLYIHGGAWIWGDKSNNTITIFFIVSYHDKDVLHRLSLFPFQLFRY